MPKKTRGLYRAVRVELFTARVLYDISTRVFEYLIEVSNTQLIPEVTIKYWVVKLHISGEAVITSSITLDPQPRARASATDAKIKPNDLTTHYYIIITVIKC